MGGKANVVKNAVAPAIRKGSFFNNSCNVSRSTLIKPEILISRLLIAKTQSVQY